MDFKSQLQEVIQRDGVGQLEYKVLQEKVQRIIANSYLAYR